MLSRHGAPKQYLASAHDDADLRSIHLGVVVHLFLNTTPQLGIGWGNLAHSGALIAVCMRGNAANHVPLVGEQFAAPISCGAME